MDLAAFGFLVLLDGVLQVLFGAGECGWQAAGLEIVGDLGGQAGLGIALLLGELRGLDDADRDRFAVGQRAGNGVGQLQPFDGMAVGVAQVQYPAQALLGLVLADDLGLISAAASISSPILLLSCVRMASTASS